MGPSFLDLQTTSDGKPYGPIRFKQLVKECYLIAKNTNTPYTALLDITPTEKDELINLIVEENKRSEEAIEKMRTMNRAKKESRRR